MGEHLLAALLSESIEALAAQFPQLFALDVAQLLLGHVLPQHPAGHVLRGGRAAAAEELHEHQGLVNVAHAHALGDGVA